MNMKFSSDQRPQLIVWFPKGLRLFQTREIQILGLGCVFFLKKKKVRKGGKIK